MRETINVRLLDIHSFKHDPAATASPTLGFRLKHGYEIKSKGLRGFRHNTYGFIGPEFSPRKPSDTYRIFCLGGSTTYGAGVETDRYSYPAILQEMFERTRSPGGKRIEAVNAGVFGYNSLHTYLQISTRLQWFSPDMYVIMDGLNDLDAAQHVHRRGCACEYTIPEAFEQVVRYERNLQAALDASRREGVLSVLVSDPMKLGRDPGSSHLRDMNQDLVKLLAYGRTVLPAANASLAARNHIPYVNTQATFDSVLDESRLIRRVWADDLHLTRYGYYLLARDVYRALMAIPAVQKAAGASRAASDEELDALFPDIVLWRPADGAGWASSPAPLGGQVSTVNIKELEPNSKGWSAFTPASTETPGILTIPLAGGGTRFRIYPRMEKSSDSVSVFWLSGDGKRQPVFSLTKAFDDSHWTPESSWYEITVPDGPGGKLEIILKGFTSQFWHNGPALLFNVD
ncbi:SGNH/GDSL hydrolase family protein [Fundidesulfovibrio soli]|uniref:SGNH/GDSL hydrolase family protein n=1 Tax=Fundidesulfovibrio soli TaxID=2922716 RepID=UPI001FAEAAB7|nr:SGNH/GDSL hydrolase family protein [Fundidesulfovibrio soli]